MRVLCIQDSPDFMHSRKGIVDAKKFRVFFGETYTVVEEVTGYKGEKKWVLAERPKNIRYQKRFFAPISDIDEKEFELNKVKEVVL